MGLLDKTQKVRIGRSQWGMILAHLGIGVFVLGVAVTEAYSVHRDQALKLGDSIDVAGYTVTFMSIQPVQGPNYHATQATMDVSKDGKKLITLYPEKRTYRVQRNPMTEAGIDARLHRDLYLALGDDLGNDSWSVRFQYKPLVRFIWLGCIIMALGGLIAVSDKRYRVAVTKEVREGGQEALAGGKI